MHFLVGVACCVFAATAISAAGCGGTPNQAKRTAELVAVGSKACRERDTNRALAEKPLARFIALAHKDRDLPRVKTFESDIAQRKKLRTTMQRALKSKTFATMPHAFESLEDLYHLDVRVYDDEKALGLSACLGPPPRAPISG